MMPPISASSSASRTSLRGVRSCSSPAISVTLMQVLHQRPWRASQIPAIGDKISRTRVPVAQIPEEKLRDSAILPAPPEEKSEISDLCRPSASR